jgi:hypothetical protein
MHVQPPLRPGLRAQLCLCIGRDGGPDLRDPGPGAFLTTGYPPVELADLATLGHRTVPLWADTGARRLVPLRSSRMRKKCGAPSGTGTRPGMLKWRSAACTCRCGDWVEPTTCAAPFHHHHGTAGRWDLWRVDAETRDRRRTHGVVGLPPPVRRSPDGERSNENGESPETNHDGRPRGAVRRHAGRQTGSADCPDVNAEAYEKTAYEHEYDAARNPSPIRHTEEKSEESKKESFAGGGIENIGGRGPRTLD